MSENIPFNKPSFVGSELENISDAIRRGQLAGDGYYTKYCEKKLEEAIPGSTCYLTHSCTAALEIAAILCDLREGDEVIMPSFTFVSTANAVALRMATPVFVDIRPDTLNIDETKIERAITKNTRAIYVVHYAGVVAEMDQINAIALKYNLTVVEDAAQALGSTYKGRPAGSLGMLAAISFHETKNVISGEGGALVCNSGPLADRAAIVREKGTNRRAFFEGLVDKYSWVDIGSSFLPGELIAAFLAAQLDKVEMINARRHAIWRSYAEGLARFSENGSLELPNRISNEGHNAHLFYVLLPSRDDRSEFISYARDRGIMTPFHYIPLHTAPAGKKFGRAFGDRLPVTESVSERLVRLPLYYSMTDETVDRVIEMVKGYMRVTHG